MRLVAELVETAAALFLAAALLGRVDATLAGGLTAAAGIAAANWLYGYLHGRLAPRANAAADEGEISAAGCAFMTLYIALMFLGFVLVVPLLVAAVALIPGFDVRGFWAYVATAALVYGMGLPRFAVVLVRRRRMKRRST